MKKTQLQFIKEKLLTNGEISRNHCLRNYISRLSARILDLEKEGWVFTTEKREGDFVYKAAYIPETFKEKPITTEMIDKLVVIARDIRGLEKEERLHQLSLTL